MKATDGKAIRRTGLVSHAKYRQKARERRMGTEKISEGKIERGGPVGWSEANFKEFRSK